jgi:hypothetical protein
MHGGLQIAFQFNFFNGTHIYSTLVSVKTKKSNFSLARARRMEILGPEPRADSDFNPPTFCVAMLMKMS